MTGQDTKRAIPLLQQLLSPYVPNDIRQTTSAAPTGASWNPGTSYSDHRPLIEAVVLMPTRPRDVSAALEVALHAGPPEA